MAILPETEKLLVSSSDIAVEKFVQERRSLTPRVYSPADIVNNSDGAQVLPVVLNDRRFDLPVQSPVPGVRFAYLDLNPNIHEELAVAGSIEIAKLIIEQDRLLQEATGQTIGAIAATTSTKSTSSIHAGVILAAGALRRPGLHLHVLPSDTELSRVTAQSAIEPVPYHTVTGKDKFIGVTDEQSGIFSWVLDNAQQILMLDDVVSEGGTMAGMGQAVRRIPGQEEQTFLAGALAQEILYGDQYPVGQLPKKFMQVFPGGVHARMIIPLLVDAVKVA